MVKWWNFQLFGCNIVWDIGFQNFQSANKATFVDSFWVFKPSRDKKNIYISRTVLKFLGVIDRAIAIKLYLFVAQSENVSFRLMRQLL